MGASPPAILQEALNSVMGKAVVNSTVQAIPLRVVCSDHANEIGA